MTHFFKTLGEKTSRTDFWVLLIMLTWGLCLTILCLCVFTTKYACDPEIVKIFSGILKTLIGATTLDLGITLFWKNKRNGN